MNASFEPPRVIRNSGVYPTIEETHALSGESYFEAILKSFQPRPEVGLYEDSVAWYLTIPTGGLFEIGFGYNDPAAFVLDLMSALDSAGVAYTVPDKLSEFRV